jgi:hypothetical protein
VLRRTNPRPHMDWADRAIFTRARPAVAPSAALPSPGHAGHDPGVASPPLPPTMDLPPPRRTGAHPTGSVAAHRHQLAQFLRTHATAMLAVDFSTSTVRSPPGALRPVVLEVGDRYLHVLGVTGHPDGRGRPSWPAAS